MEEIFSGNRPRPIFFAFGVDIAKGYHAVLTADDVLFLNDTFIQVLAEVNDCLVASADILAVDNPLFWGIAWYSQILVNNCLQEFRPEDLCQGFMAEEISGRLHSPKSGLDIDACPRHDNMDMGVIVKISRMGVENGYKARRSVELFIIFGKALENTLHTGNHQGVDGLLIFPSEIAKLTWKSEGDQIIWCRQKLLQLVFDPLPILMVLAMGTIPVSAGMGNRDLVVAMMIGASGQHVWAILLSALFHCPQGIPVPRQNCVFILREETVFKLVDDGREEDHFLPSQRISNPLTRALIA